MSGQSTSQITVSCNTNAGQVCAEGFDSLGISTGTQCMSTVLGSNGGGNWTLWPTGNNTICDDIQSVYITPTITYNGGGGCPTGCGSGISNPNIIWAIYSGQI